MADLTTLCELFRYNDAATELIVGEAAGLSDGQLDRQLDLGMGSLRLILQHILAGEVTWLARIQGNSEAKWPARPIPSSPVEMQKEFRAAWSARDKFLSALAPAEIARMQTYRDSKGSLFRTTLHQMLMQLFIHSTHHRAQAVNAIRRVGGRAPEVDFMYAHRQPG